ncbi:DUF3906 family protein [Bacillus sp. FJAT-47783]|uniref:DUF3906 family protein n=1 Tax=Bacillus sp. FJAT-47783 TaxID=2922712 RepID=UPI001FAB756A|nr:DUF3906 family protein [Bacillus sp. FJAT-47783]
MNGYKFLVKTKKDTIPVIIVAENEEKAFDQVEIELEKHFMKVPHYEEITLYEKKKIQKGVGFVIDNQEWDT